MKKILTLMAIVAVGMLIGWQLGENNRRERDAVCDTTRVTVVDTVPYYYPVPKDSVVTRWVTRTLPVAKPAPEAQATMTDTAAWHAAEQDADTTAWKAVAQDADSAAVLVPIEQKVYEDSTYKAWASGYMVSLDSIYVFPKREVVTITKPPERVKPKRFGFGLQVGCGYDMVTKQVQPFYVGVGGSWNIFVW